MFLFYPIRFGLVIWPQLQHPDHLFDFRIQNMDGLFHVVRVIAICLNVNFVECVLRCDDLSLSAASSISWLVFHTHPAGASTRRDFKLAPRRCLVPGFAPAGTTNLAFRLCAAFRHNFLGSEVPLHFRFPEHAAPRAQFPWHSGLFLVAAGHSVPLKKQILTKYEAGVRPSGR